MRDFAACIGKLKLMTVSDDRRWKMPSVDENMGDLKLFVHWQDIDGCRHSGSQSWNTWWDGSTLSYDHFRSWVKGSPEKFLPRSVKGSTGAVHHSLLWQWGISGDQVSGPGWTPTEKHDAAVGSSGPDRRTATWIDGFKKGWSSSSVQSLNLTVFPRVYSYRESPSCRTSNSYANLVILGAKELRMQWKLKCLKYTEGHRNAIHLAGLAPLSPTQLTCWLPPGSMPFLFARHLILTPILGNSHHIVPWFPVYFFFFLMYLSH